MKYLRFFSALLACLLMLSMGACAPREAVAAFRRKQPARTQLCPPLPPRLLRLSSARLPERIHPYPCPRKRPRSRPRPRKLRRLCKPARRKRPKPPHKRRLLCRRRRLLKRPLHPQGTICPIIFMWKRAPTPSRSIKKVRMARIPKYIRPIASPMAATKRPPAPSL